MNPFMHLGGVYNVLESPLPMENKAFSRIAPIVGGTLLLIAIWVLYHKLSKFSTEELLFGLSRIPPQRVTAASLLTVIYYFTITGYDMLGLLYIKRKMRVAQLIVTSFVSYALGHSIGMSAITGNSVRIRMYGALGLSAGEISRIIAVCSLTFWVGFLTMGSALFLSHPIAVPADLHLPFETVMPLGAILVCLLGVYIGITATHSRPIVLWGWHLPPLSLKLFAGQVIIGSLDWILAASVLYVLLPYHSDFPFVDMLAIFLLAQFVGLASQVPAGIGIFESVVLLLLPEDFSPSMVLGILIVYRVIFYLVPLIVAIILLGINELLDRRRRLRSAGKKIISGQ